MVGSSFAGVRTLNGTSFEVDSWFVIPAAPGRQPGSQRGVLASCR